MENEEKVLLDEDYVEQVRIRREKLANLVDNGENPYAQTKFIVSDLSTDILANPSNCQLELDEYNAIKGKYYETLGDEGSKYWQCIRDDDFE